MHVCSVHQHCWAPQMIRYQNKVYASRKWILLHPNCDKPSLSAVFHRFIDLRKILAINTADSEDIMPPLRDRFRVRSKLTKTLSSSVSCEFATQLVFVLWPQCEAEAVGKGAGKLHPGVP